MTEASDTVQSTPGPVRVVIRKHGHKWTVHHRGRSYGHRTWVAAMHFTSGLLHLDAIAERFSRR